MLSVSSSVGSGLATVWLLGVVGSDWHEISNHTGGSRIAVRQREHTILVNPETAQLMDDLWGEWLFGRC